MYLVIKKLMYYLKYIYNKLFMFLIYKNYRKLGITLLNLKKIYNKAKKNSFFYFVKVFFYLKMFINWITKKKRIFHKLKNKLNFFYREIRYKINKIPQKFTLFFEFINLKQIFGIRDFYESKDYKKFLKKDKWKSTARFDLYIRSFIIYFLIINLFIILLLILIAFIQYIKFIYKI